MGGVHDRSVVCPFSSAPLDAGEGEVRREQDPALPLLSLPSACYCCCIAAVVGVYSAVAGLVHAFGSWQCCV